MNKYEELVCDNIGMAHDVTRKYLNEGYEYDDLFQTACIGLVNAAKTYNESKGYAFSTYAYLCMNNELRKFYQLEGMKKRKLFRDAYRYDDVLKTSEKGETYLDKISSEENIEETIVEKIMVEQLLEILTDKERNVIKLYFGIGCSKYKQKEICKMYGVTDRAISQIVNKSLKKMRLHLKVAA